MCYHLNLFFFVLALYVFLFPPVLASFLCYLVIALSMCLLCLCIYFIFCDPFAFVTVSLFSFLRVLISLCFDIFVF